MSNQVTAYQTGHVGLNVSNLEQSRQFYQDVFNFDVQASSTEGDHQFVFLGKDDRLVLTLWQQSEGQFGKHTPGLHHLSFQVDNIDALRATQDKLRAMGTNLLYDDIVTHAEGIASGAIYFEDPDGIRLEVYSPDGAEDYDAPADGPACGFF